MSYDPVISLTLEALLAARDRRAERQQIWLSRWGETLISLTLVWPGEVKDGPKARLAMLVAVEAFELQVQKTGWQVNEHQVFWLPSGPEAFWSVTAAAEAVKGVTVVLEDEHPLGRLWDMDVFGAQQGLLSRSHLGQSMRPCLLCEEPARACARSRRHPLVMLMQRIEDKIDGYVNSSSI